MTLSVCRIVPERLTRRVQKEKLDFSVGAELGQKQISLAAAI